MKTEPILITFLYHSKHYEIRNRMVYNLLDKNKYEQFYNRKTRGWDHFVGTQV